MVCTSILDGYLAGPVLPGSHRSWAREVTLDDRAATDWETKTFGIWHACGIKVLFGGPNTEPENSEPTLEERVAKLESILLDIERQRHGGSETPLTQA